MLGKRKRKLLSHQKVNAKSRAGLRQIFASLLIYAIVFMSIVPTRILANVKQSTPLAAVEKQSSPTSESAPRAESREATEKAALRNELAASRNGQTATELNDGSVLIVGGDESGTAEIYFADAGQFGATGTLNTPRRHHSAVRLNDGRVLITGGESKGETLASAEIFDPSSGKFIPARQMNTPRARHTTTLLADGRVLVAGDGTAEIYDAASDSFAPVGAMTAARSGHSAITLNDGRVLIVGGADANGETLASSETFEISTNEFRSAGEMANARKDALLRVLHDGKVQIIGGADEPSMEIFDPNSGVFGAHVKIPANGESFPELFNDIMSAPTRAAIISKKVVELSQIKKALSYDEANGLKNGQIFNSSKATVSTEALNYPAGSPIVVTGNGFQPFETVELVFCQNGVPNERNQPQFLIQTDESGAFRFDGFTPDVANSSFLIAAKGTISGEKAQTSVDNLSADITQIAFNPTGAVNTFTVGLSNPSVTAGTGWRVRTLDSAGDPETVTGAGESVTIQLSSNSANGQFSTNSAGPFSTTISISIGQGSQNTPNIYYRDATAGTPLITATVTAKTTGLSSLPLNSTATQSVTVNKANSATAVSLTAGTNPSVYGEGVSFTAIVSHANGGTGTPSGTVNFKDGATTIGTEALNGSGQATITTSSLSSGSHSITAEYSGDGNFNVSTSAALSHGVDTAEQIIVFEPLGNKNYGDADFTVEATGGGSGNPVTFSTSSTACTVTSGGLVHLTGAGTCSITANQAGNSNYNAADPVSQSFSIAPKSLTATVTVDNKIYDGTTTATILARTLSGVINSDDVTATGGTATFNNKNVGTDKPVTISGLTLGGANAASYVIAGIDPVDANITQRDLTVTVSAQDKTYDGNQTATATITGDNRVSGDDVTTAFTSASFDNKNVGEDKTVTVSGISITGGMDMGNYSIVPSAATMADIDPLALTVNVTVSDKIYDRTPSATILTRTLSGVISPDDVTVSGGTATFTDEDAEEDKAVTISGLTLGGLDANNYSVTGNANAFADIDPKPITVTATADDKSYDTTTTANVSLASSDVISPDVVTFARTSADFASADVGTHTVTVLGITLGGADASNYSLTSTTATDTAEITQASQTITFAQPASPASYNSTFMINPTASSGLTVSVAATGGCTYSSGTVTMTSGTTDCVLTASQAGNLNFAAAANVERTVSASKIGQTITFAQPTSPAAFGSSFNVAPTSDSGLTVDVSAAGGCSSSSGTVTMISGTTACVLTATQAGDTNYLAADPVERTVSASLASQTITFDQPDNKTFGDADFSLTASASSMLSVSFVSNTPLRCTVSGATVHIVSAGTCSITASQDGNTNYSAATPVTRTFSIAKAPATITLSNLIQIYNGSPRAVTVITNPTGLESNVSVTYDGSPTAPTNAGSYAVVAVLTDDNYEAPDATGTLVIDQATQTINFTNPGPKTYGNAPFSLIATGGGSSSPVTFSSQSPGVCTVSGSTATIVGAGSCTIRASQAADANHSAAPNNDQTFAVAKAPLSVTADNQMITFGQPDPPFTFDYDGFVNGDDELDVDTPPTCSVSVPHTDAGTYSITCSGGEDNNYSFGTYNPGTLTVSRAGQTISFANPGPKIYGNADFGLTATGGASGNPVTFVSDTPAVCTVSGSTLHIVSAGTCMVTASQAGNGNYDPASSVQQSFVIGKADAVIVVNGGTFPYDGLPHGATGTATGVLMPAEDLSSLLDLGATFTNVPGGTANWTFAGNDNYNPSSGSASITINALTTTTTVTFELAPYIYRGTAFTATAVVTANDGFSQTLPVSYSGDCTNVTMMDGCTATASFAGDGNHAASNGSASITIVKAPSSTVVTFDQSPPFVYTGNPLTASARVTGAGGLDQPVSVVYSGDCTNVSIGGCTATADFTGDSNHDPSSDSETILITQASSSTVVTFVSSPPYVYTGNPFTATARVTGAGGLDQPVSVTYSGDCTNVSMSNGCTASASFAGDSNHAPSSNSVSITITPAAATLSLSGLSQTYDGNPKPVTVTTTPNGLSGVSILYSSSSYPSSSTAPSDAGSYDVTASLLNVNYTAPDATGILVIGRSSQTITFGVLDPKTYGDADFTISASSSSMLDVSFSSQTSSVCTVSSSSSVWSVHIVSAGVCTVRASQSGSSNYDPAADVDQSFTIAKFTPTVSVTGGTFSYDGNPHPATGTVTGANSENLGTPDFTYTPPGDSTAPVNAGSYSVVGSFAENTNYNSASSGAAAIMINQAGQTITFGMLPNRTYGDAPFTVSATGGGSGNPVTFAASGQCTVSGNTVTLTAVGSCTITASQAGNSNYSAATPVPQMFTIAPNMTPVNVFIQSPLASQLTGTTLTVPVMIQGVNGHDIEAFAFRMNYDPNVLTPLSTPFDQTGTISTAFNISHSNSSGQLTILGDSGGPVLFGGGVLLNLKFSVSGAVLPGDLQRCLNLSLSNVALNELPSSLIMVGGAVQFCVINGQVSGKITYPNSPTSDFRVPGVTLTAVDGINPNLTAVSDGSGVYSLSGFFSNNYVVTPTRTPDLDENVDFDCGAISGSDVTRVRNFLLNPTTTPLTADQQFAADVSGNGDVSAFDVSQIRRYILNQTDPNAGQTGTWKFKRSNSENPNEDYTAVELQQNIADQDYRAYLMGDVTGNWTPNCPATIANPSIKGNEMPTGKQDKTEQVGAPVNVNIISTSVSSGTNFNVPIQVDDTTGLAIEAYQFDVTYDPAVIQPQSMAASNVGTLSSSMTISTAIVSPGRLRILADSQGTLLAGSGVLLNLKFTAVGTNGTSSNVDFLSFRFNEGVPSRIVAGGVVNLLPPTSANVEVSGSLNDASGNPVGRAIVILTDERGQNRTVATNNFGRFRFDRVSVGETYTISARAKGYVFTPQIISVVGDVRDVILTAEP